MKILHVVPTYYPAIRYGGPIWSVHSLCKSLATLGHEIHVFTSNVDGNQVLDVPIGQPVFIEGVSVFYFPVNFLKKYFWSSAMFRYIKESANQFDFMHLHSCFLAPTAYASSIARKNNIPWCVAPRGALVPELIKKRSFFPKSLALKSYEKVNLENAKFIHATSELEKTQMQKLHLSLRDIKIIPNGVDVPDLKFLLKESKNQIQKPYILYLGRISWKKRLDRLILAMKALPDFQLVIAGNDEENLTPNLIKIALQANVNHQIDFLGPTYGILKTQLLANAQALILPSENENFGNVVLESLACSRPVAVSQHVGLADTIINSGSGIVISDDPEKMGSQLADFLSNQANLELMGDRGLRLVLRDYAWRSIAQKTAELYAHYQDKIPVD
jgi:glycosyltransferase involved in cell wall biosynthesis